MIMLDNLTLFTSQVDFFNKIDMNTSSKRILHGISHDVTDHSFNNFANHSANLIMLFQFSLLENVDL